MTTPNRAITDRTRGVSFDPSPAGPPPTVNEPAPTPLPPLVCGAQDLGRCILEEHHTEPHEDVTGRRWHRFTLEEYDRLHAAYGLLGWWLESPRRVETETELACGMGPGDLRRPMMGCGYVDQHDGTCLHPLNLTPECHRYIACPVLELRVPS